ncbi:MAG: DUF1003 domain-containing protein [Candidatus Dormibacteraeota bacterium]|nr:DUF1003 domain-containing protein [Candidatus Dormibacteraeota bacterium]
MSALVDRHDLKEALRQKKKAVPGSHKHPVNQAHFDERDFGERIADRLAAGMGSWTFLTVQTAFIIAWVAVNLIWLLNKGWDPYPFILLNLALSLQATYAGPIVLLAGNRQSAKDRETLEHAATEADKGGEAINHILQEIRKNTTLTLQILESLEKEA